MWGRWAEVPGGVGMWRSVQECSEVCGNTVKCAGTQKSAQECGEVWRSAGKCNKSAGKHNESMETQKCIDQQKAQNTSIIQSYAGQGDTSHISNESAEPRNA